MKAFAGGIQKVVVCCLVGSYLATAQAGVLSSNEVARIESGLGIVLTAQEKADLGAIVKPDSTAAWRAAAEARIAANRKANLQVQVADANGNPVPGAAVAVNLRRNAFNFGGILNLKDFTDVDGNLQISTARYRELFKAMYNSAGLDNGFKPKQRAGNEALIPGFLSWAQANGIPVRGHTLIWPGTLSNNHLPDELPDTPTSYSVLSKVVAVEAALTNGSSQATIDALKTDLRQEINYMIGDWASKWSVFEWDVINETLSNYRVQDLLGDAEMAEWFKVAASNAVDPDCGLMINEFQIVSARSEALDPGHYTSRRDLYMANIDLILANGGRVDRIGFQNRIKFEVPNPQDWYNRLDDFAVKYGIPLVGTEFEVKDSDPPTTTFYPYNYTEMERAQITESLMTTYYSHPLTAGLNAWTYMKNEAASMCYYDGSVKLNGLVWYYLHRIRYATATNGTTGVDGSATVTGFKGDYDITVSYGGNDYPATVTLSSNQTSVVVLGDVVLGPSDNPPVFVADPVNLASATSGVAYVGQTLAGTATDLDGDALAYSKIAGPAWLAIAPNGGLSGTPTVSDAGQNSWIVQVSDGFDTDTAVLKIDVVETGGGSGPGSNVSIVSGPTTLNDDSVTGDTVFSPIALLAGDVVAISTAPNKSSVQNLLTLAWTGTEGVDGTAHTVQSDDAPDGRAAYVFYVNILKDGSYGFTVDAATSSLTAQSSLFVIRANSGLVQMAGSAILSQNTASPGISYGFSSATLPKGIAIESFAANGGASLTVDAAYSTTQNANGRNIAYSSAVSGSAWNKVHTSDAGSLNYVGAGAVFCEVLSGGGNQPPVFGSDPVAEAFATVGAAYSATLADNASDGDLDAMSFAKVSGPGWLSVAANGSLSGTPAAGDLGSNSWKVLVTDGTATNFANLQITVANPPPTPQQGTNVLFIAIDDMKPLLGCYGDPLAVTPNIDTLASRGVAFQNAQCQWAVCGPSHASISTGIYPEETGVMGFKKMRGDAVDSTDANAVRRPNLVTLQQWFRYHNYRTAATGKINDYRCVGSMDPITRKVAGDGASKDDPPSWGEPVDPANLPADFFSNSAYLQSAAGWSPAGNPSTAATNLPDAAFADGIICGNGLSLLGTLAAGDTQFFLGVGFKKPHLPFVAPQQYWDLYDRNAFHVAEFQDHPLHEVSYTWNYAAELAGYDDIASATNIPPAKQLELIHGYYACASFIDAQIGRLLAELDTLGLSSNTIVVLWGDHGFHLGDHAEWAKHTNLEQAARVPFIIYSPFTGVAGAKPVSPVGFVDIYPTLCELAGLPIPQQPLNENEDPFTPAVGRALKGKSLVPVMQDPSASLRTGALTLFSRDGAMGYAYRTDRYRYIEWVNKAGNTVVARELYDYDLDPLETVNLAGEPGYGALMYQYSVAMRGEMGALGLGGGDIACAELQGSPAVDTSGGNHVLLGVGHWLDGSNLGMSWPGAAGWSYKVMAKTNLTDAVWQLQQGGLTGDVHSVPANKAAEFFRIELDAYGN